MKMTGPPQCGPDPVKGKPAVRRGRKARDLAPSETAQLPKEPTRVRPHRRRAPLRHDRPALRTDGPGLRELGVRRGPGARPDGRRALREVGGLLLRPLLLRAERGPPAVD